MAFACGCLAKAVAVAVPIAVAVTVAVSIICYGIPSVCRLIPHVNHEPNYSFGQSKMQTIIGLQIERISISIKSKRNETKINKT